MIRKSNFAHQGYARHENFCRRVLWIAGLLVAFPTHANVYTCHTLCDVKWLAEVEIAELRDVLVGESQDEINGRDDFDWTPLHLASRWSRAEAIEALIHAGVELVFLPDEIDITQFDPYHEDSNPEIACQVLSTIAAIEALLASELSDFLSVDDYLPSVIDTCSLAAIETCCELNTDIMAEIV